MPGKKANCSRNTLVADESDPREPVSGAPGLIEPLFTAKAMTGPPTMNQAPPRAAMNAPKQPTARCAAPVTSSPPSSAAAPGTIESHSRPEVYAQALSGVYAKRK